MKAAIHRLRSMAEGRKDDGVMLVVRAAERYEFVRTLAPIRFAELFQESLRGNLSFDQIIDREMHDKFANVFCSQCGQKFGPGDHGFSQCENHKGLTPN